MKEGVLKINETNTNSWMVSIDGKEMQRVKNNLTKLSDEEKTLTVLSAARVLSNCPSPETRGNKTGLVIGKIQSGKTSSFISMMALAFDNLYNIIVVFGGTKKNLLEQTVERIEEMFDIGVREDKNVVVLNSDDNFDSVSADEMTNWYRAGKKIIIVALKHQKHILGVRDYILAASLGDKPILMFDDEGDQASLNTKEAKRERSATFSALVELKSAFLHSAFISITATPQANLLIDTVNHLSPDFCHLIEPGKEYTGGRVFHGEKHNSYIMELPDDEVGFLEGDGIPRSFYCALSVFFVGSIIRQSRSEGKGHSMLIHSSQKKFNHTEVNDKLKEMLRGWRTAISSSPTDPSYLALKEHIKFGYDELMKTVDTDMDLDTILNLLEQQLNDTRVLVLNSDTNSKIDYSKSRNIIIIGGNMIERGLTIEDLAVTYIVRRAKEKANVDTVEQRARWFGYRRKYLDVCRIFCTQQIREDFSNILEHEEDLWAWVKDYQKLDKPLKELPRAFELSGNLNPTRKNVIPNVFDIELGKWSSQRTIFDDPKLIVEIKEAWSTILSNYEPEDLKKGNVIHSLYRDIPLGEVVYNVILKYYDSVKFKVFYPWIVCQKLSKNGNEPTVDIVVMRKDEKQERAFDDDFNITSTLMQGHSTTRDVGDPLYYPGDSEVLPGRMQFQIHNVHPKNDLVASTLRGAYAPMICFYVPKTEETTRIIGGGIEW